jgi:hypothetical protein
MRPFEREVERQMGALRAGWRPVRLASGLGDEPKAEGIDTGKSMAHYSSNCTAVTGHKPCRKT